MDTRDPWLGHIQSGASRWKLVLEMILWILVGVPLIMGMMVLVIVFVLWLIDPSNDCPTGYSYDYWTDDCT